MNRLKFTPKQHILPKTGRAININRKKICRKNKNYTLIELLYDTDKHITLSLVNSPPTLYMG